MKKLVSSAATPANIATVSCLLAEMPGRLEALCRGLAAEQLRRPPRAGERSIVEILAHLLNSEARTAEAINLALLLEAPLLADLHPERQWGRLLRYDRLPFPELLSYFKLRRVMMAQVLGGLNQGQWARTVLQAGKQRQESIYWQARALALHELEHLAEIEQAAGVLLGGAWPATTGSAG